MLYYIVPIVKNTPLCNQRAINTEEIKVSNTYQFYWAFSTELEIRLNDSEGRNSVEELIISIMDRAAKGHVHYASVEEKKEKGPIRLRI